MTQIIKNSVDAAGNTIYPGWLIDLTPGAAEAYKAWTKASEAAKAPALKVAELIRKKNGMTYWAAPGDRQRKPSVPQADLDAVVIEIADTQREADVLGRRATAARSAYDDLMKDGADADSRRRAAAAYAVARQEEVENLTAALLHALEDRDAAFRAAGEPGRHWSAAGGEGPNTTVNQVERGLSLWARGFDTDAARRVVDGHKVMSQAEMDAADAREAERLNNRAAANTRARSRRAGF